MTLPILDLPSDPRSRGLHHGNALREAIALNVVNQIDNILSSPATAHRGVASTEDLMAWSARYEAPARSYAPDLWVELEAVAEGANQPVLAVLMLNLHLEMIDLANAAAPDAAHEMSPPGPEAGCTNIAAVRSDGSGCVLAQTYDLRSFYEASAFGFSTHADGLSFCGLSFAGVLAANGMNGVGFALVINKLYARDARVGVPHPFVVRRAIQARTTGRAISAILGAERACGIHYLAADTAGLLFPLETTAGCWDLLEVGSVYEHTNHFSGPRLRSQECRDFRQHGAHTILRLQRARQLMRRLGPDADCGDYAAVLDDRHDGPLGISCSGEPGMPFATVGKALFDTGRQRAFLARGRESLEEIRT